MKRIFLLTIIIISIWSCKSKQIERDKMKFFDEDYYRPESIKTNKVKTRMSYSIKEKDGFNEKKLFAIYHFNSNGYLTLKVKPIYKYVPPDTSNFSNIKTKILQQITREMYAKGQLNVESNIETGFYDSTFYNYNENWFLIKKIFKKGNSFGDDIVAETNNYKYDDNGNLIENCNEKPDSRNFCSYKLYEYDKNYRVINYRDSFSMNIVTPKSKKYNFEYDNLGRVIYDGICRYQYNEKNFCIFREEIYQYNNIYSIDKNYFELDNEGNKKRTTNLKYSTGDYSEITFDEKKIKFDTSYTCYSYKNNLLIETTGLDNNLNQIFLNKFEYTYY